MGLPGYRANFNTMGRVGRKMQGKGREIEAKWRALEDSTLHLEPKQTIMLPCGARYHICPAANAMNHDTGVQMWTKHGG